MLGETELSVVESGGALLESGTTGEVELFSTLKELAAKSANSGLFFIFVITSPEDGVTGEGAAPDEVEEPVEGAAPEVLEGAAPDEVEEPVEGAAPEVLEGAAPEVLEGDAPEVLEGAAPERLEAEAVMLFIIFCIRYF